MECDDILGSKYMSRNCGGLTILGVIILFYM